MSCNFAFSWAKVLILQTRGEVYHINARAVSVVGKNLHNKAELVVYNSIRFMYSIICSSGHVVPSKAVMFRTLIFFGLGVTKSLYSASWGPQLGHLG